MGDADAYPMPHTAGRILCTLVALVNAVVACAGNANAAVLCLGPDGHVAIESPAARTACCRADSLVYDASVDATNVIPHACVDIPLTADAKVVEAHAAPDVKPAFHTTATASFTPELAAIAPAAHLPRSIAQPPPPATSLAAIESIVLLV